MPQDSVSVATAELHELDWPDGEVAYASDEAKGERWVVELINVSH